MKTATTRRSTTFTTGSGCYKCQCCGRKTRDDGRGDSVNSGLCAQCYELGGLENEMSDYGDNLEQYTGRPAKWYETRMAELRAEIVAKGGVVK